MAFIAPLALLPLLFLPLLLGLHLFGSPRRRPSVSLSSLGLLGTARARHPWRRHVGPSLLLPGLALLSLGAARPVAELNVPARDTRVMLALDVSGSMGAEDIAPSRLEATKAAALRFLDTAPREAQVGLVAFNQDARLLSQPTTERDTLRMLISHLQASGGTAAGDGILQALNALAGRAETAAALQHVQLATEPPPAPSGVAGIVLLTDGETNAGEQPLDAAGAAALLGVRVFSVGLGSSDGVLQAAKGERVSVGFDEATLRDIAQRAGGRYYAAPSRQEVERVFGEVAGTLTWRRERLELSFAACALAAPLLLLAVGLSHRWTHRYP
jgi:Ca-activated chloride channel family protein